MTVSEIQKELEKYSGSLFITASQITRFVGEKNQYRVTRKFLAGLDRLDDKRYFVPEVAKRIHERCK